MDTTRAPAWYGTVLAQQAQPEKQVPALWHLARAAAYHDAGGLPDGQRRILGDTLERLYTSYHGETTGLDQVRAAAAAPKAAFPPAGFDIESVAAVAVRKQDEELSRTNPQLATWIRMRRKLDSPEGEKYFAESLRNTPLPRLKGTLIRSTPPDKPNELVVAISDLATPEIVVKLATPFPNEAEIGAILEFEGAIDSFVKSPFGLTVLSDPDKISGWPPPAPKHRK